MEGIYELFRKNFLAYLSEIWEYTSCGTGTVKRSNESKLLTALSALRTGEYISVQEDGEVMQSSVVRINILNLCKFMKERYRKLFMHCRQNSDELV